MARDNLIKLFFKASYGEPWLPTLRRPSCNSSAPLFLHKRKTTPNDQNPKETLAFADTVWRELCMNELALTTLTADMHHSDWALRLLTWSFSTFLAKKDHTGCICKLLTTGRPKRHMLNPTYSLARPYDHPFEGMTNACER